jgi:hypothetical protein
MVDESPGIRLTLRVMGDHRKEVRGKNFLKNQESEAYNH